MIPVLAAERSEHEVGFSDLVVRIYCITSSQLPLVLDAILSGGAVLLRALNLLNISRAGATSPNDISS